MRIQLLIASSDSSYTEHLSSILSEEHKDAFDVSVCSTLESLKNQIATKKIDIALMESSMIDTADLESINLPLLLWSDDEDYHNTPEGITRIRKYQRISEMVSNILELYSKGVASARSPDASKAHITVFWAPVGGVGTTTAALAYSANRALDGKQVMYLDLEYFSSVPTFFNNSGKSISSVFEMLESEEGNIKMLIRSISKRDNDSGISYFCRPENFDDMNILSIQNTEVLVDACSEMTDELVIDMSSVCDMRTQRVFDLADRVFMVTDSSHNSQVKFSQFATQHSIFHRVKEKTKLIANKGAVLSEYLVDDIISLPLIQSHDPISVYKTLSSIDFDAQ